MNESMENLEIDAELAGVAGCNIQQGEIFRVVNGTEERYAISNKGRLFDRQRRRFVRINNGCATLVLGSRHRTATAARLVAEAFLPNPQGKKYAVHKVLQTKDEAADDSVENLFWGDWCDTLRHRAKRLSDGEPHPFVKKKIVATSTRDGHELHYDSMKDAEKDGYLVCGISNCVRGRKKLYKGYTWREVNDG